MRDAVTSGGEIHVHVTRPNGHYIITVEDTSVPVEVDPERTAFSKMLLEASALQLGANIERKIENGKTIVEVKLRVDDL